MKKAVVVVNQWSRNGGLETVCQDIARALTKLDYSVTVLPFMGRGNSGKDSATGAEVRWLVPRFGGRLARSFWARYSGRRTLAREIDAILGNAKDGLLVFGHVHLLKILDHLHCAPRVEKWAWTYGIDAWSDEAIRWRPYVNRLDRVISDSAYTAMHEKCGGFLVPVSVVPNSIDLDRFTPTSTPEKIRRDEIMICSRVSKADNYKGHDQLIEALPLAEKKLGRPLRLRVVGGGDDLERLKQKAMTLGLGDRVLFTGRVSDEALLEAYRHCGVFAMPSRAEYRPGRRYWAGEGFGLVYAEAEACGRPVVVSTDGGAPETAIDGETGIFVEPRSPEAIASAIAEILSDSQRADAMGRAGRSFVEAHFSFERFCENIAALLSGGGMGK